MKSMPNISDIQRQLYFQIFMACEQVGDPTSSGINRPKSWNQSDLVTMDCQQRMPD